MTRSSLGFLALLSVAACSPPTLPEERFPQALDVHKTLYSEGAPSIRETCEAVVVELTDVSAARLSSPNVLQREGWRRSPLVLRAGEHLFADGAMTGCNSGHRPLGDINGALKGQGAYYKVVNGGEGLAVIMPRSKLAAWFYFG